MEEIMEEVSEALKIHDSGIGVELLHQDDRGLSMRIKIYELDKFLGFTRIAEIINKVLAKYDTRVISLTLNKKVSESKLRIDEALYGMYLRLVVAPANIKKTK